MGHVNEIFDGMFDPPRKPVVRIINEPHRFRGIDPFLRRLEYGPPRPQVKVITEPHWFRGLNYFQSRTASELDAIERDNAGWWLREYAFARWASDTVFPQAIERRLREISRKPYAQRGAP